MKLRRPDRKQQSETIIALIDVVFFLLVFFMLIGRMDAPAPFETLPPLARSGQDLPAGGVTLALSATGELALDGAAIAEPAALQALQERLRRAPDLRLRVNAHRQSQLRRLLPLVARAEAMGYRDIALVVTPGEPGG
jgi:biopolymer transport protein ExbD